jgi:hypothetical protein
MFTATETTSDGIRVQVIITVPDDIAMAWKDVRECNEVAGMGVEKTMAFVEKGYAGSLKRAAEEDAEAPF